MRWEHGFSAKYYATVVDPKTWKDIDRFEITGGSIIRSISDLMESADINCVRYPRNIERWIRIYLDARQSGSSACVPLFTGLATSPDSDYDGTLQSNAVQCYSVLQPAQDIPVQRGWYAPVGVNGAEIIKRLLSVISAPVEIEAGSPELKRAIIAEENETHLSMSIKVLNAINWRTKISGDGTVTICPKATTADILFNPHDFDMVEPQFRIREDWYKCPNVFKAVMNDAVGIARDDNPDSILSTVRRGREVWRTETDCHLNAGETLDQYAKRRLKEEQTYYYTANYSRRFIPELNPSDIVEMNYPNISGRFVIINQTIELGYGARTSEEVQKL